MKGSQVTLFFASFKSILAQTGLLVRSLVCSSHQIKEMIASSLRANFFLRSWSVDDTCVFVRKYACFASDHLIGPEYGSDQLIGFDRIYNCASDYLAGTNLRTLELTRNGERKTLVYHDLFMKYYIKRLFGLHATK